MVYIDMNQPLTSKDERILSQAMKGRFVKNTLEGFRFYKQKIAGHCLTNLVHAIADEMDIQCGVRATANSYYEYFGEEKGKSIILNMPNAVWDIMVNPVEVHALVTFGKEDFCGYLYFMPEDLRTVIQEADRLLPEFIQRIHAIQRSMKIDLFNYQLQMKLMAQWPLDRIERVVAFPGSDGVKVPWKSFRKLFHYPMSEDLTDDIGKYLKYRLELAEYDPEVPICTICNDHFRIYPEDLSKETLSYEESGMNLAVYKLYLLLILLLSEIKKYGRIV